MPPDLKTAELVHPHPPGPLHGPTATRRSANASAANARRQSSIAVDDVRPHLVNLRSLGISEVTLASQAGVCRDTVSRILQRRVGYVHGPVAAALLAVRPGTEVRPGRVHVAGTARRLRWLAAMGWALVDIARRTEIPHQTLSCWAHQQRQSVPADDASAIAALYDDLYSVDGPSSLARDVAERNGWHEQVWLDEDIDNPAAAPLDTRSLIDEVAVQRVLAGDRALAACLARQEVIEVVRLGSAAGASQKDLAELLGTSPRQICRIRARLRAVDQPVEAANAPADVPHVPELLPLEAHDAAELTPAHKPVRSRRRPTCRRPRRVNSGQARHRGAGTSRRGARRLHCVLRIARRRGAGVVATSGSAVSPVRPKGLTRTSIEWCRDPVTGNRGFSWNFVDGCEHASPGCDYCYAEGIATRFAGSVAFPHGFALSLREDRLDGPLLRRTPARIFANSMSDLGLSDIPVDLLVRSFAVMARCPQHTFLILTKRPTVLRTRLGTAQFVAAVRALVNAQDPARDVVWPLPNVHVGVSVEDQAHAWRVLELFRIPAALHWVSAEPLIGRLDLRNITSPRRDIVVDALAGDIKTPDGEVTGACPAALRWVVVGGESGTAAGIRPMHPAWEAQLRADCTAVGVAYFMKQWGAYAPYGHGAPTPAGLHGPITMVAPDGSRHNPNLGALAPAGSVRMARYGKHRGGRTVAGHIYDAYPQLTASANDASGGAA